MVVEDLGLFALDVDALSPTVGLGLGVVDVLGDEKLLLLCELCVAGGRAGGGLLRAVCHLGDSAHVCVP